MKPTIILLSGWKRSGKDTAAAHIVAEYGAQQISFAGPLKDLVSELFGVDRASIDNPETKEEPIMSMTVESKDAFSKNVNEFMKGEFKVPTYDQVPHWTRRALCILVGSTMRAADPDFWIKKALAKTEPGKIYVISDCRYKNEIETVKASGANVITIRINRFKESSSNDPSERDLDDYNFDMVIDNHGTVEDLYAKLNEFLNINPPLDIYGF